MKNKTIALIPLRGGSKSIPKKNIKLIAGKPLCAWVLEAAVKSNLIDDVYVSTDSDEIANVVNNLNLNIKIIKRPSALAKDTSSTEAVMLHFAKNVSFNILVTIQATSPLTEKNDINKALKIFKEKNFDSLLTGVNIKRFFWDLNANPLNYNPNKRPRRQNFKGTIIENGAFYITKREILSKFQCRLGGTIGIYEMGDAHKTELDEPGDWPKVERQLLNRKLKNIKNIVRKIKLLIVDIDGTMTDGGMYYSEKGEVLKKFNTRDAKGLSLLMDKGIKIAIMTSENSKIVQARAKKLNIEECYINIKDKLSCIIKLNKKLKIDIKETAFIGDDLNDLNVLESVGFSASPSDAIDFVKQKVLFIAKNKSGHGAVREVCDFIQSELDM